MPPFRLHLPSPAKLNLFLHITGQREDGYHNLQTLFQILDYGDELNFTLRDDGVLSLSPNLPGVADEDNLIIRAARLLQQETGTRQGANIHCNKKLPMGAGLGGGSSNAATTLVGLNQLWKLNLPVHKLAELGLSLGADVPVFIEGNTAWAEGVGEKLQALTFSETQIGQNNPKIHSKGAENWFLVVIPPCHVATEKIFKTKQLTRNTSPITIAAFLEGGGHNDCQPVVEESYPEVKTALDWLGQYAPCQMTGTGSAIFARFPNKQAASKPLQHLPATLEGFVAQGVDRSPLHSQ